MSKELNDKVSPSNKSVFDNLTEGQKNRILNAPIGTNVEGVNVDEKIKFELRQYEMSNGEEDSRFLVIHLMIPLMSHLKVLQQTLKDIF